MLAHLTLGRTRQRIPTSENKTGMGEVNGTPRWVFVRFSHSETNFSILII